MTDTNTDRVADATPDNWVYRLLPKSIWPYAQLARWDRPIGWWLLLWPCWWSLALAVGYFNYFHNNVGVSIDGFYPIGLAEALGITSAVAIFVPMFLFLIGAIAMRGAGCTYNDIVDTKLDAQVARTASRPIPSGRVSKSAAIAFLVVQALIGFVALLSLCFGALFGSDKFHNEFAFFLALSSLVVVACYPFAKRVTDWPQFVLGLAFSWGALMGWAIVFGELSTPPVLLYIGCVLWTIGYDTIYAHQDREDDALVGVRSTARLFGEKTKGALVALYLGTVLFLGLAILYAHAGVGIIYEYPIPRGYLVHPEQILPAMRDAWPSYLGLIIGSGHMLWQIKSLDINDGDKCLKLFQSNKHFGWIVFAGLIADILV